MKYAPTFKNHMHRYCFAMEYAWKKHTLDVGCAMGQGAQILSMVAQSMTGMDISKRAIKIASRVSMWCSFKGIVCNFDETFPDGQWETITAFEVIEHVKDPDLLVKNIAEHLVDNGVLVFSVPHMCRNKEHLTLFDEQSIKDLISKYLTLEEFYIQDHTYLSNKPMFKGLKCYVGVARKK